MFAEWIDTFVSEKGLDVDHYFEVEGPEWGTNFIPLEVVIDACKTAPMHVQADMKTIIVKIDFLNGDVMHFFEFLAKDLAL